MDAPEGFQSSADVLIQALEAIQERGITRVIVCCFDIEGRPVGWLTNVDGTVTRLGLLEVMKHSMLNDD